MNGELKVQFHHWPWSVGGRDETVDLVDGKLEVPFYGSPVLSLSVEASILLAKRYEKFFPFGPNFETNTENCQLYQVPHGVASSKDMVQHIEQTRETEKNDNLISFSIKGGQGPENVSIRFKGALGSTCETEGHNAESPLYRSVLSWSNFFDECIEETKKSMRMGKLPWAKVMCYIKSIESGSDEPRKALIVHISEAMRRHLPMVVLAARRILVRERKMLPGGQATETDTTCLRWYVRQPGENPAQKAAANRQRLLAVSRRESLDTLENMVLKDFLFRCKRECRRYVRFDCSKTQQRESRRAQSVTSFGHICSELHRSPKMAGVSNPPASIRPNYVLQSDSRYRQIWKLYIRLRRQEDEEDRLWDWQSRTWADIARLLVNASLMSLCEESNTKYYFQEILKAAVDISHEQSLGSRIRKGSEPGPFLVKPISGDMSRAFVLEVVHSSLADEHPATQDLGRTGGHLYLVLTPLKEDGRKNVIVVWAVHTAACNPKARPSWATIGKSATDALERHASFLGDKKKPSPMLHGFVLASALGKIEPDLHPREKGEAHLVMIPTDQEYWAESVGWISLIIDEILEQMA